MMVEGYAFVTTDDGNQLLVDTIEHDGGLWLVPCWLDTPYPGMSKPARLIRLDSLARNNLGDISGRGAKTSRLRDPMPKGVLEGSPGQSPIGPHFDVREAPDLLV